MRMCDEEIADGVRSQSGAKQGTIDIATAIYQQPISYARHIGDDGKSSIGAVGGWQRGGGAKKDQSGHTSFPLWMVVAAPWLLPVLTTLVVRLLVRAPVGLGASITASHRRCHRRRRHLGIIIPCGNVRRYGCCPCPCPCPCP